MSENILLFFRENQELLLAVISLLTLIVGQQARQGYKRRARRKALECKFPVMEKPVTKEDTNGIS